MKRIPNIIKINKAQKKNFTNGIKTGIILLKSWSTAIQLWGLVNNTETYGNITIQRRKMLIARALRNRRMYIIQKYLSSKLFIFAFFFNDSSPFF